MPFITNSDCGSVRHDDMTLEAHALHHRCRQSSVPFVVRVARVAALRVALKRTPGRVLVLHALVRAQKVVASAGLREAALEPGGAAHGPVCRLCALAG